MRSYIKIAIWFVFFMLTFGKALDLINAPSTIANIVGFAIMIVIVYVTEKTKFFLNIKNIFNFKNNKENEKNN